MFIPNQMISLLGTYLFILLSPFVEAEKIPVFVGDNICVSGYVMDNLCIDRGTLLDAPSIKTLGPSGPLEHSMHCLVEIDACVRSGYEILEPLEDGTFGRAWRMDSSDLVVSHMRQVGDCGECDGVGSVSKGYRATINATVLDLGSDSTPSRIEVTAVQADDVGCGGLKYEVPTMVTEADEEADGEDDRSSAVQVVGATSIALVLATMFLV